MRIGDYDVRPVGGPLGCLAMIAFSLFASIILTLLLNAALHLFSR